MQNGNEPQGAYKMLELTGSEKQINWATTLRETSIKEINNVLEEAKYRVSNNTMPAVWEEIVVELHKGFMDVISKMDSKQIIDSRNISAGKRLFDVSVKKYNSIKEQ